MGVSCYQGRRDEIIPVTIHLSSRILRGKAQGQVQGKAVDLGRALSCPCQAPGLDLAVSLNKVIQEIIEILYGVGLILLYPRQQVRQCSLYLPERRSRVGSQDGA